MANLRRPEQTGFPRNREGPARHAPDPLASTVFPGPRVARQRCQPGGHGGPSLSQVTGQAGISLRLDLRAGAARVAWVDDGGSLSLRNLVIDNGCVKAGDCPDGRGGNIPLGAAQLGLSLPIFGVEQPTLALDVTTGSGGRQQLAISLPDLATINDQLIASGLPAQRIRLRVASDLYIGDNSIGRIELRDITDLRGTIKVWGH